MKLDIKNRLQNYLRVMKISKKPNSDEFWSSAKICFVGLIVVGIIGYIVYLISILAPLG